MNGLQQIRAIKVVGELLQENVQQLGEIWQVILDQEVDKQEHRNLWYKSDIHVHKDKQLLKWCNHDITSLKYFSLQYKQYWLQIWCLLMSLRVCHRAVIIESYLCFCNLIFYIPYISILLSPFFFSLSYISSFIWNVEVDGFHVKLA